MRKYLWGLCYSGDLFRWDVRRCLRVDVVDSNIVVLDEDFAFFGGGDGEVGFVL